MTQRPIYAKTTENVYQESLTPFFVGDTPVRYDDPEAEEAKRQADKLLAEKQSLIDTIKPLQNKVMNKNSDVWAIKSQDSENDDELTTEEKEANTAFNKKVIKWRKKVRKQNNNITTDNTLTEIQARIDMLNALDASFPEI